MIRGTPMILWIFSVVLGSGALFLTFQSMDDREEIERLFRQRETTLSLADELRQSSDDLTRFARTYAATADPFFRDRFQSVLDIRNGKSPRPVTYEHAFWDLEVTFFMNRSKMNSDALVNIENEAFDLVERGRADEAMMMLFSDSYHRAKANIMRPIRSLQESMDQQTSEQLEIEIERQRKTDTMIVAMLLGALIFGTISGLWRRPRTEA
jgi:hypothetical protein